MVEGIPQLVWRAVELGVWTWASPQWQRYTGQTTDESSGWGWLDAVHPEDRDALRSAWQQAPQRGGLHADLRIRSIDGTFKWFQTRAEPVRDDAGEVVEWLGTSTDVDDLRRLEAEKKVLVAELQHRTRNLIAVIHSICGQTLKRAESLDDFRDRFEDRLSALSRVKGLLSTSEHDPITIRRLLQMELRALGDGQIGSRVALNGPETVVRYSTAQTMALAVHELSTNALKYGALSSATGRLSVDWHEHAKAGVPWLRLTWRETGAPPPPSSEQPQKGYGRILIEQALPRQLGAATELTFSPTGMSCTIDLPLRHVQADDVQ